MSCIYFKSKDKEYHCVKCHKDVCTSWYHRYCQNYNYDACIIYKEKSDKYYRKPGDVVLMEWKKEISFGSGFWRCFSQFKRLEKE